ncbi:hypothetical protein SAMN05216497_102101 [Clostridium cochlearium]|uniref:Uncharacterized protein n=1 Tax=Clostridium cochlearium TaxID=1494 RepID=A0ABY0QIV7_CLOCO|nr:hypothetical protein [Clostridium cochlearium]SDK90386.1 hypothetical protein SAMN05216497_102101 [Clostridium cochlearium]
MGKKKKGSSLIMVVMVFAILMIFGSSVLTLTLSSYQKRVVESKEKRNRYFSESGLDIAYGIIGKIVDKAVENGNTEVENYLKEELKQDESILKEDGSIDEEKLKQKQSELFRSGYQNYVLKSIRKDKDNCIEKGIKIDDNSDERENNYDINGNKPEVKLINKESEPLQFKDAGILKLEIQSTFKKENIEKKIRVNYNISTPDYNGTYYVQTNKVQIPKLASEKAIYVDGNLDIKGNFTVDGDIYVKGNENSEEDGINIYAENCNAIFKKQVVTAGDFRIKKPKGNVKIYDNIYAGNFTIEQEAINSTFNVNKDVYLNNDLELNANKSNIKIEGNLYGIGDVTNAPIITEKKKPKYSSSILINSEDIGKQNGSSITIGEDALLMGTAYIATEIPYQTGESIAIKGNYRAYTYPLKSEKAKEKKLNEEKILFEYRDPLTLATKRIEEEKEMNLNFKDKSDYFKIYSEEYNNNGLNLGKSGLNFLGSISSIGASISNGSIKEDNYTLDKENFVKDRIKEYENMIFKKDSRQPKTIADIVTVNSNHKNIGDNIIYVQNIGKPCILVGKNHSNTLEQGDTINLNNGKGKGVIVTTGDVYLYGDIDFTGTIIAGGSIIVEEGSNVNIINDKNFLKSFIATNYNTFKDVFVLNDNQDKDIVIVDEKIDTDNVGSDIIRDKLITMEKWRIVK